MTVDEMLAFTDRIEGWMSHDQRVWIYETARSLTPPATWIEVGVWKGRSLIAAAAGIPDFCTVIGVDAFRWGSSLEQAARNVDAFLQLYRSNVGLIVGPSVKVAKSFSSVDVVFIDAAHDRASAYEDLVAWGDKVRPGGILCGHDLDEATPGVEQALASHFGNDGYDEPVKHIWRRR